MPSTYSILFKQSVLKDLKKLPKSSQRKLLESIEQRLSAEPRLGEPLKGNYKGLWRYRQGIYRIVYSINDLEVTVLVLKIAHRKEVYRGLA